MAPRPDSPQRAILKVKIEENSRIRFIHEASGTGLALDFQRTLRIPDDGKTYPLPPGLGAFPVRRVLDYQDRVPASWVKTSGVFIPMYQREAMWIAFRARHWRPNAVKIAAGKINAVSGKPWDQRLSPPGPGGSGREVVQDYFTVPPQPWLDGFNTGEGTIRQFVAMPLGMGYTVEGQVTGKEEHGGLQIIVYEPRPGCFPDKPPPPSPPTVRRPSMPAMAAAPVAAKAAAMGLGAGGTMKQKIYADPHGIDTWDEHHYGRVFVHIVNSVMWSEITGEPPPPTPVSAQRYTSAGYPWYELYDEEMADVAPSPVLAGVKSIAQMDAQHGFVGVDDDDPVDIAGDQIKGLPRNVVPDGDW
jgi:hypothetical protein